MNRWTLLDSMGVGDGIWGVGRSVDEVWGVKNLKEVGGTEGGRESGDLRSLENGRMSSGARFDGGGVWTEREGD